MLNINRHKLIYASLALFLFILLSAATAFAGTASISWTAPTTNTDGSALNDLDGYKLHYGTTSGSYTQTIDVGNVTTYEVTGLTGGTTYYFAITAYNVVAVESTYSNEITKIASAVVDITPPVISGVYADPITSSSAQINWSTDEASDTQVEYGTTMSYGYINPLDSTMTTVHSQAVAGLVPSTLYNYRVLSRDASGNLTTSGNYTFTTTAVDITAPVVSNVQVTSITDNSVTVTWTTDEGSTSQVEYGETISYGSLTTLDATEVTSHSVDLTSLSGSTTYDFRVRSSDASSNEVVSGNYTFTTSNTAPATPSLTADITSGTAPLTVNFSASASDSDGYITTYEWDYDGDGVYDANTGAVSGATNTYSTVGTYNARVRVTDNGGASATSGALTISVSSGANQPPTISYLTPSPSTGTAPLDVTFTAWSTDPDGSIVQYEWDFDGNGTYDATTADTPVAYNYTVVGTFVARMRVTDNLGGTATAQTTVTVTEEQQVGLGGKSSGGSGGSGSGGCFIASAAFGSYLEPNVEVLRDFRDRYLLTNGPGTAFVKLYYRTSPPIADYISRHDGVKLATRVLLTPVVYGVRYPKVAFLGFAVLIVSALFLLRAVVSDRRAMGSKERVGDKTTDTKIDSGPCGTNPYSGINRMREWRWGRFQQR